MFINFQSFITSLCPTLYLRFSKFKKLFFHSEQYNFSLLFELFTDPILSNNPALLLPRLEDSTSSKFLQNGVKIFLRFSVDADPTRRAKRRRSVWIFQREARTALAPLLPLRRAITVHWKPSWILGEKSNLFATFVIRINKKMIFLFFWSGTFHFFRERGQYDGTTISRRCNLNLLMETRLKTRGKAFGGFVMVFDSDNV